jgi:hypothetical protein
MFQLLRKLFSKRADNPAAPQEPPATLNPTIAVTYDDWGFYLNDGGATPAKIAWEAIDLIAISIEDDLFPFPYWYIGNRENLLRISNDAVGGKELFFDGLSQYINGYHSDATFQTIIEASTAMEGSFVVWKKAVEEPT